MIQFRASHAQIFKVCQSQRDCVPKPRVARNELPWGSESQRQNPNGVSALDNVHRGSQPRWGCCFVRLLLRAASVLATLGFVAESRWDSRKKALFQNLIYAKWISIMNEPKPTIKGNKENRDELLAQAKEIINAGSQFRGYAVRISISR